jgi:hypothetical protein
VSCPAGSRARDDEAAQALISGGKEHVGPQRAEALGEVGRYGAADERRRGVEIEERRNHPQERQSEAPRQLLGALDPVVEILEEERQSDGEDRSRQHADQQVVARVRRRGTPGCFRRVDDADVAGAELAGNGGFRPLHRLSKICRLDVASRLSAVLPPPAIEVSASRFRSRAWVRLRSVTEREVVLHRLDHMAISPWISFGRANRRCDFHHLGMVGPSCRCCACWR